MDTKTVLLSALLVLASGAILGVCPQDEDTAIATTTEAQEQLDQPHHRQQGHQHNPNGAGGTGHRSQVQPHNHHHSSHHHQPYIPLTPHHQPAGMWQHYPRYDSGHQGYDAGIRISPYAVNGGAVGHPTRSHHAAIPMDSSRPAPIPIYGHAPVFYHPANVPVRQYTTKVYRTHRRGSAVIPYEGASVRVPATWGQRKAHSGTIRTSVWPAGTFRAYSPHYNQGQPASSSHPSQQRPFQSSERGITPVTKRSGGRAQRAHLDNEVDTSSAEGASDESLCLRCPKKRLVLVAKRGESKAVLKLPDVHRRCPGRKALRGKKRRPLTRHGRFRGVQGDEERASEGNLTVDDNDNIRLEALWGPSLGTMAGEGRHMSVFTLLHNNRAVRTCHVTMVVKVLKCNPLLLPANTRARCSQETVWGSRCEFLCVRKNTKATYVPTDVKETTCEMMTVSGQMGWSHEPPACLEDTLPASEVPEHLDTDISEGESCAMPFAPSDGFIFCGDDEDDSSNKETVPVGTICHYKCSPGFRIPPMQRHLATTKCLVGGDWSTAADPYCEKIVEDVQETMLPKSSIMSKNSQLGK